MDKCKLQAHRGVSTDCPENTMAAFRASVEQGYDIIELDPKFTADNRCVILHDRTLNRTGRLADGSMLSEQVAIASLTYEEARSYDVGLWFGEKFRGEKMPSLEEVLAFALEANIPLKLDNVWTSFTDEQKEIFFAIVRESGAAHLAGFTSAKVDDLLLAAGKFPESPLHYDGLVTEEILSALRENLPGRDLTAWLRYDNAATSWNKNPPADVETSAMVKKYAKLGLWILSAREEYEIAANTFRADVIETTGSVKPC